MKVLFDSSVLVPAVVDFLPGHPDSSRELQRVHSGEITGVVAAHGLAETWAVATGIPVHPPIPAGEVLHFLKEGVLSRFEVVSLDAKDYEAVLEAATRNGVRGRVVFDMLHVAAARKADVDQILTYDVRDFRRAAPDLADRIRTP